MEDPQVQHRQISIHIFNGFWLQYCVSAYCVIIYLVARVQKCIGMAFDYSAYEMRACGSCGATNGDSKSW